MATTVKIKTLVLASQNPSKINELQTLLAPLGIEVKSATDFDLPDVEEDQDTFEGNAAKKAKEVMAATGLPTLADDSGLCVDALDGGPGVYTKRYGTYKRLLEDLTDVPEDKRSAYFICVLAFALPNEKVAIFEGRVDGHITQVPQGEGGFGYDPVFVPEGFEKTFAQMPPAQKNGLSHRGKALARFIGYINERL